MSDSKNTGGWSLRKALVRRIAQAQIAYERELNRPADEKKDQDASQAAEAGREPTRPDEAEPPAAVEDETADPSSG